MKLQVDQRLFWFLKEGTMLDFDKPSDLDLYVQQVLSRGRSQDVTHLLKKIPTQTFRQSFQRVNGFLPRDVRSFWEDFLRDYQPGPGRHS